MVIVHNTKINDKDILCGRDKISFSHAGNKTFRGIIEKNRKQYQGSTLKEEKTKIIVQIVKMIKESNGRFLKRSSSENQNANNPNQKGSSSENQNANNPNQSNSLASTSYWYVVNDQCAHEKVSHALRSCKHRKKKPAALKKKKPQTKKPMTDAQKAHFKQLLEFQGMYFRQLMKRNHEES